MNSSPHPKRRFFKSLYRENPDLLRAVLQFNHRLYCLEKGRALDAHGVSPDLRDCIVTGAVPCAGLLDASDTGFWDFEEESRRIMLVETDTLQKGIDYWGAAFFAPALRRVVLKRQQEALEKTLGRDLLGYALGRGGFYLGQARQLIPLDDAACPPDRANRVVRRYGLKALLLLSQAWPGALRASVENRTASLAKGLGQDFPGSGHPMSPTQLRLLWSVLKNIFLREVAPQWHPCFT